MNDFVEWIFLQLWEYTKLTFRILFWLVRLTAALISRMLNRREAFPQSTQADLFDPPTKPGK